MKKKLNPIELIKLANEGDKQAEEQFIKYHFNLAYFIIDRML